MKFLKSSMIFAFCFAIICCGTVLVACGNKTTVNFNTRGGDNIASLSITKGSNITLDGYDLPTPKRVGFSFEGWFVDEDCTPGNEFKSNTPINNETTIYAKWSINARFAPTQAAVTYKDYGGRDSGVDNTVYVPLGSTLNLPLLPNKDDKTLVGWTFDAGHTELCGTNFQVNGDISLYADWQVIPDGQQTAPTPQNSTNGKFHVSFDLQYVHPVQGQRYSCEFDKQIPLYYISRPSARPGYTFVGWSFKAGLTYSDSITNTYYDGFNRETEIMKAPTNTTTDPDAYKYFIEDNTTYYANWREDTSSVGTWGINYDLGYKVATDKSDSITTVETSCIAKSNQQTQQVYRTRIYTLYTPTRSGYSFDGWYEDETLTSKFIIPQVGFVLIADLNLYAKWIAISGEKVTVTCLSPVSKDSTSFITLGEYSILKGTKLDLPVAAIDGQAFVDWYTDSAYKNRFIIEDNYKVYSNLTLYAKWIYSAVGDVNKDNKIDMNDYNKLRDWILDEHQFTRDDLALCDVNRNGKIDRFDLHAIMAYIEVNNTANQSGESKLDGIFKLPATMIVLENFDFDVNGVVETGAQTNTNKDSEIYYTSKKTTGEYDYNQDGIVSNEHSADDFIFKLVLQYDGGPGGLYQTFVNAGVVC